MPFVLVQGDGAACREAEARFPGGRVIDTGTVEARVDRQRGVIRWITGHGLDMPGPADR